MRIEDGPDAGFDMIKNIILLCTTHFIPNLDTGSNNDYLFRKQVANIYIHQIES
jgi:hypothetical protein